MKMSKFRSFIFISAIAVISFFYLLILIQSVQFSKTSLYLITITLIALPFISFFITTEFLVCYCDSIGLHHIISAILGFLPALVILIYRKSIYSFLIKILRAQLIMNYHLEIFGVICLCIFVLSFLMLIRTQKLSWELLAEMQTLKIFTPAYCFVIPQVWGKSLSKFNINPENILAFAKMSYFCGVFFIFSLLFYLIAKPIKKEINDEEQSLLLDVSGNSIENRKANLNKPLYINSILECIGLYIFILMIIDICYFIAIS